MNHNIVFLITVIVVVALVLFGSAVMNEKIKLPSVGTMIAIVGGLIVVAMLVGGLGGGGSSDRPRTSEQIRRERIERDEQAVKSFQETLEKDQDRRYEERRKYGY